MEIIPITQENETALFIKNEAFELFGEMIVERNEKNWTYHIKNFPVDQRKYQTFPDDHYQYSEINQTGFAFGAFEGGKCVGLAIFRAQWNHYLYLDDLKVNRKFRKTGVAKQLLKTAAHTAKTAGYRGFFTIGQNNNVAACQFYLNYGFEIGGLDTKIYQHTQQKGKQNIHFYYDFS